MGDINRNNWGDEFWDAMESAAHTGDLLNISRCIGDLVNDAIDAAKSNIVRSPIYQNVRFGARPTPKTPDTAALRPYTRRPSGRIQGILLAVFGFMIMTISLILVLLFSIVSVTLYMLLAPIIIFIVLAALGLIMGVRGIQKISFVSRFLAYTRNLGNQEFVPVANLAQTVQKSIPSVNRDLQKMIDRRFFFEGHLDTENNYLILTDRAYDEYLKAKDAQRTRQEELERLNNDSRMTAECRKIIEDGQAYVARIRESNDQIPDECFSAKLDKMEQIVRRIFDEVRLHPEVAPDLQKMMEYYLPTTAKLLDAYRELDNQPVTGEHIAATKKEIEDAVDTLNTAFEKLFDSLFADRAWDISSDISVLHTVLAQDGLTKDDFAQ